MSSARPEPQQPFEEAVVLCGGLGTRLRAVLADRPKAMAPVCGRPFLEWLLIGLARRGLRRVVMATGHLAPLIHDRLGDGARFGLELRYSREAEALGTAGALRLAWTSSTAHTMLVLNGDSYCRFNLAEMLRLHRRQCADATLWLEPARDGDRFGSVEVDADGRVLGFHEKVGGSSRRMASAGVYLMERSVLDGIPSGQQISLERDVFPALALRRLYGVAGRWGFVDIGTPDSLREAESLLAGELAALERQACKLA